MCTLFAEADSPLLILGGDTVIVLGEHILGKPQGREETIEMLLQLSGKTHQVLTGVSVLRVSVKAAAISHTIVVTSSVTFGVIDVAVADAYWAGGEPAGKAGAYAIQGYGARFVEHLSGSYSNVVGLPLFETACLIAGLAK
jgi:septum formation protein